PRSAPLHGGHGRAPLLRTGSPRAGPTAAFPADPEVHSLAWGSGRPSSRKPLPRQKNILVIISSPAPRLERTPLPPSLFSTFQHGRGLDRVRLRRSGDIGRVHWLRQSSVPSLVAGLLFGSLAGLGAYQLSQNPSNVWISLITSGTLTAVMGTRFYNSGKFMPAGLIAGVSLLMVGRLALKMLEKPHEK
uniref:Transmembrane protein 14C n=1 Tax=Gallus gallus TaxID=9031 RepID=A0A8V0Y3L9_CHICK